MNYVVTKPHRSEYPNPIRLNKGDPFVIGEKDQGPEGWDNWFFCTAPGQAGGWVPLQVIERLADGTGRALEDYTARELDVDAGETLIGFRILNGWVWCERLSCDDAGWVPLRNLEADGE
ncbi:ligand-binding protein SH3 [Burkholderia ubonensis]|uniref:Ligand-binding protein SH3 n=1 Tax=Burkholderia ubonensis TaxID=101571 RepID=A0A102LAB4_9BURK|nr:SH3 domain-containing protein [Burkholderia ubonensis]KUZ69584.1 ligand-binding protein SH3 [Burkholderia ubonensis]KUZ89920.1 ligand-binding protein SH3 [Burkholderia ubonensis]KVA03695.1 ligand-binding protein SH3 [Burkholderia ubonensis]